MVVLIFSFFKPLVNISSNIVYPSFSFSPFCGGTISHMLEIFTISSMSLMFLFDFPIAFFSCILVWIFSIHTSSPLLILLSAISNLILNQSLFFILPLYFSVQLIFNPYHFSSDILHLIYFLKHIHHSYLKTLV